MTSPPAFSPRPPAGDGVSASPLGILAGNGDYPTLLARRLIAEHHPVSAVGIAGETDRALVQWTREYRELPLGALGRTASYFRRRGIGEIFFAGGICRPAALLRARPDRGAVRLALQGLLSGDDRFLKQVADWFAARGITVGDPTPYIEDLFASHGRMAGPQPTPEALRSLATAWSAAKRIGRKDRGQAAVARGTTVLAVEGPGGTDRLLRGVRGSGGVLAKVVKPGQDRRFDMPTIGPRTILHAAGAGISAIGVQGGGVLILDRREVFDLCDAHGVSLTGFPSSGPSEAAETGK